ncbi:SDR family oxidoreductase [Pacificimonas sp. ICDLI1SI03]
MNLALVTGGTQRIGAAIAARLAEEGWALALHYHTQEEVDEDLAHALAFSGVRYERFAADLSQPEAPADLFSAIEACFGSPVTALVNSASMFGTDTLATTDASAISEHFAVNATAPALLCKEFAARLPDDQGGVIVNLLDQRLQQPHGDNFAYTLSKYALAGLTEILARSLAPRIRVNAVAPGLTLPTESYDAAMMMKAEAAMPLNRLPDPEDVADAVAFLLAAPAVTGETIHVDAGARHVSFSADFDRLD